MTCHAPDLELLLFPASAQITLIFKTVIVAQRPVSPEECEPRAGVRVRPRDGGHGPRPLRPARPPARLQVTDPAPG